MHHHLEVIMPPTEDVAGVLAAIMEPFNEQPERDKDEDGDPVDTSHAFWDYWLIGGRWAGTKMERRIGAEPIKAFYAWMKEAGIMQSGVQFGKPTIATAEMREQVDAKWRETFPGTYNACPFFDHSGETLEGDIAKLKDVALDFRCAHVIIAVPSHKAGDVNDPASWVGPVRPEFMISDSIYNGVTCVKVQWDGTLGDAIRQHNEKMMHCREAYRIAGTPGDDWLVVTIDYHS